MAAKVSANATSDGDGRNRLLFITANTGSLFEETSTLEAGWIRELVQEIETWQPAFFALHMQEIGGKNYRKCMRMVRGFIHDLHKTFAQYGYSDGRCYLDEEMEAEDRFTALGSVYFCHRDFVRRVNLFDFRQNVFKSLAGFEVHSLNPDGESTVERKRFPKSMFSEVKWSRKGFMRTRWRIDDSVIDLVNIHLFHDACNLLAVEQSPSVYSGHRRDALAYVLQELGQDDFTTTPMFLFGDFNFRLDTRSLIDTLAPMSDQLPIRDGNGIVKVEFRKPKSTECILSIGTKSFEHEIHEILQYSNLLKFDKELTLCPQLSEWPITFPPSYPYSECTDSPTSYMKTRAPAWCDRVLMNDAAWKLVQQSPSSAVSYSAIGQKTCMGDHKPVFLTFPLSESPGNSRPVNGDAEGAFRFMAPALAHRSTLLNQNFVYVANAALCEAWERLARDVAPSSDHYAGIFEDREYQIYAFRIESLELCTKNPSSERTDSRIIGEINDDFITIVMLHDDQTVTVMDASSYGFAFNESWGGSLGGIRGSTRIFDYTDEHDDDFSTGALQPHFTITARAIPNRSCSGSSISRCSGSTYTVSMSDISEEVTVPDFEPGLSNQLAPPPPPKMCLFDSSTDGDLILRRKSILHRYPYYSDIIAVKDERGWPEAVYAKPISAMPTSPKIPLPSIGSTAPEKPQVPKRSFPKQNCNGRNQHHASATLPKAVPRRSIRGIDKGTQVEFNWAFVHIPSSKSVSKHNETLLHPSDKIFQTDSAMTGDENSLANEIARRRRVGLDRWGFDPCLDIARERFTADLPTSTRAKCQSQKMEEIVTVEKTIHFVQKRPISLGDRKLAQRRRHAHYDCGCCG